jgi:cell division protein DivIC
MNRKPQMRHKKKSANRTYIAVIGAVLLLVLTVQMVRLYQKNQTYITQEEALQQELEQQQEKQQELSDYEEYINSEEYIEDTAKQKLGLVYDNEIIFREK